MIYYLAGPMTGLPLYNYPAFDQACTNLRAWGFDILSPHEIEYPEETERGSLPYSTYTREGLKLLLKCEGIILLPGWTNSKGCNIEYQVAKFLEMEIRYYQLPV